jgi:hypothetical protein
VIFLAATFGLVVVSVRLAWMRSVGPAGRDEVTQPAATRG